MSAFTLTTSTRNKPHSFKSTNETYKTLFSAFAIRPVHGSNSFLIAIFKSTFMTAILSSVISHLTFLRTPYELNAHTISDYVPPYPFRQLMILPVLSTLTTTGAANTTCFA
jgi:hypothetical protein